VAALGVLAGWHGYRSSGGQTPNRQRTGQFSAGRARPRSITPHPGNVILDDLSPLRQAQIDAITVAGRAERATWFDGAVRSPPWAPGVPQACE
jgi:hypothetical protein